MKKLFCLLGAFISVGLAVQAKEAMVQPSTEIVEEVIVVKEEIPKFKPWAIIKQELEYFGPVDGKMDQSYWRFRPAEGEAHITEKLYFDFRSRFYTGHDHDSSNFRARAYYDHGYVGDTKINWTGRYKYEKDNKYQRGNNYSPSTQALVLGLDYNVEYEARFDFKEYFPKYDNFEVTSFVLAPAYAFIWEENETGNNANTWGVDFYSTYNLPWGFSAEFNTYFMWTKTSKERITAIDAILLPDKTLEFRDYSSTKDYMSIAVEFYIYNTTKLWESQDRRTKLTFELETGFDPWVWTSKNLINYGTTSYIMENAGKVYGGSAQLCDKDYYLKAIPELKVVYKFTDATDIYLRAKVEYGNQITASKVAKNWRWQPQAVLGWSTKF